MTHSHDDHEPIVRVWTIAPENASGLSMTLSERAPGDSSATDPLVEHRLAIDASWALARAANPRLYDGPIVLVDADSALLAQGRLVCRPSSYRTLVAADTLEALGTRIRALGVQGLVIGRDRDGDKCLLFGRRGPETRVYPGLWENAPSGTVAPPQMLRTGDGRIGLEHLRAALCDEGLEELGIDLSRCVMTPAAIIDDPLAHSIDVVLRVDVTQQIDPRQRPCPTSDAGAWEYLDLAWVPIARVADWLARSRHAISPPTLALLERVVLV